MKDWMNRILHSFEWLYLILLFSPLLTVIYVVTVPERVDIISYLYLQSLLICIPIILTDYLEKWCKNFAVYFIAGFGMLVGMGVLARIAGSFTMEGNLLILFQVLMVIQSFVFWILHYYDRMAEIKSRHTPDFAYCVVFILYYIVGILFDSKLTCDIAFFSMILYLTITVIYQFFKETNHYIRLNHAVKNVPVKRLFGIGGAMMACVLAILVIVVIPSIASIGLRPYTNIRDWKVERPIEQEEMEAPEITVEDNGMSDFNLIQELDDGTVREIPMWLKVIINSIFAFCAMAAVFYVIKQIFQRLASFQTNFKENEDIIETLEDTEEKLDTGAHRKRGPLTEKEIIRKRYKKTIRKYRKDRPYAYETPAEIEKETGLAEKSEMQELHHLYEEARYGK